MNIEHVAIWTDDLEVMKRFYVKYFHAAPNEKYVNSTKGFSSYFLCFESGARLEIMQLHGMAGSGRTPGEQRKGFAHLAFSLGSRQAVDALTSTLREEGYPVLDGPRTTGDGYYESTVLDPESNRLELTV